MREHINAEGRFQSDKYPTCPAGKVPLSTRDKNAQDLLWEYAQRRRPIDAAFSDDLEFCLKNDGYESPPKIFVKIVGTRDDGSAFETGANSLQEIVRIISDHATYSNWILEFTNLS